MLNTVKNDLNTLFSKGINADTPEMVTAIVIPAKKFFEELLPEFKKFRKPEKVVFVKETTKFFEVAGNCLTTVQAIDLHNMLEK